MTQTFSISSLLKSEDPLNLVQSELPFSIETKEGMILLKNSIDILKDVDRFQQEEGLEDWIFQVSITDDEALEVMIYHNRIDLVALLLEDDLIYTKNDILDSIGIDGFYLPDYQNFLQEPGLIDVIIHELRFWEGDSSFHPYAIDHLQAIFQIGSDLAPFGDDEDQPVELSFDEDEIFIGSTEEDAISANPDYNLLHEDFDVSHPKDSIARGIQTWSELAEEDDDWDDQLDDDEWVDEDVEDWDSESEDEWDPGFEEEIEK